MIILFPNMPVDVSAVTPAVRRAQADVRKRIFRKARRERIAAKERFLRAGH